MHKIVILCTQLEAGGAQRAAIRLAEYLRNRGHVCENWFLYRKSETFKDVPHFRVLHDHPKPPKNLLRLIYVLRKEIILFKPNVVISFAHNANLIGLFVAFLCGVQIRIASHRNPKWGYMSTLHRLTDFLWAVLGIYTEITAVSESTKASYSGYPPTIFNRIRVIQNGLAFHPSKKTRTETRNQLELPLSAFIIGNIGRLSQQKNQQLLLHTLSGLDDEIHLVIAGEGKLRENLLEIADMLKLNKRVHFIGELSYEKIPDLLKAIDVFVLPSQFEGLSNALLEAMNAGLPVICSSIDAQKEVLINQDDASAGFLLPPDDPEKWSDTISKLWSDKHLYNLYSKRSQVRANAFTMKAMGNGFLELIERNQEES
ncbi:MAG: glycosyltransferase family 4 protein [Balneolales bacterium]